MRRHLADSVKQAAEVPLRTVAARRRADTSAGLGPKHSNRVRARANRHAKRNGSAGAVSGLIVALIISMLMGGVLWYKFGYFTAGSAVAIACLACYVVGFSTRISLRDDD